MKNKEVVVIGAGTMGNGIAQVFAMNGFRVQLYDVFHQALDRALVTIQNNLARMEKKGLITPDDSRAALHNIITTVDLNTTVKHAALVIEAATENIDLKLEIFKKMDVLVNDDCILATNTSSISITKIATVVSHPERVIGMHFMNPVPIMKLVEVIRGYNTSDDITIQILELSKALGKDPVEVNDYPGFVANRILMPMINESIFALYEGVAGVQEIDTVMMLGMAHPMGPLALADFIGLDVCHSILQIMYQGFGNPKYAPCPLLTNMVVAGKIGRKSGEGFYQYGADPKVYQVSSKFT